MDLYNTGPGGPDGSRETVAGYLHPRGASMVGELSPALLARTREAAPQPAELRLQSASPVRRPDSPPARASSEQVAPQDHEPDHRKSLTTGA